jgi:hypothetical protein
MDKHIPKKDPKKHSQKKHKLQALGRESMEEMMRQEGEKHPGGG